MARADEAVEPHVRRIEHGFDGRHDGDVIRQDREVRDAEIAGAQNGQGGRRRRRFEADREEDDLAIRFAARELQRVERRIDHADVGAPRHVLQRRAVPAGHAHHVAERR